MVFRASGLSNITAPASVIQYNIIDVYANEVFHMHVCLQVAIAMCVHVDFYFIIIWSGTMMHS